MKNIAIVSAAILLSGLMACGNSTPAGEETNATDSAQVEVQLERYGDSSFNASEAIDALTALNQLKAYTGSDSLDLTVKGKIAECCKKKGCWMRIEAGDEEVFVRFKDYGFFVPLNSSGRQMIMHGKMFTDTTSVAQLQHYAHDEGKTQEEIDQITEPQLTYGFLADGVILE